MLRKKAKTYISPYVTFASATVLSSFLLFVLQPIAGKHLLPYFGGSSSIWATSLLFFTAALFLGYLYVFWLSSLPLRMQRGIHAALAALSILFALVAAFFWHSFFPGLHQLAEAQFDPSLKVLFALLLGVGLPYLMLSTTAPLLQHWYGSSERKDPYSLYALSNVGSLFGLLSYPFIVEPFSTLKGQEFIWLMLFIVAALLITVLNLRSMRTVSSMYMYIASESAASKESQMKWVALAALPSFMLVATTTQITQIVAPVPLLWVLPMALYLITFILAFAGFRMRGLLPLTALAASGFAFWVLYQVVPNVLWALIAYPALLLFTGLLCHEKLYAMRPQEQLLTRFYLMLSFGGMCGALLASLVAPLIFEDFWEFPIGVAFCAIAGLALLPEWRGYARRYSAIAKMALIAVVVIGCAWYIYRERGGNGPHVSRNFYGVTKVKIMGEVKTLIHGKIIHGFQYVDPKREHLPTSYYAGESGIGRALIHEKQVHPNGMSVGVIGLGIGTIAYYCGPHDRFVFYEIDARIEEIARSQFSYLAMCRDVDIRLGDARLTLSDEANSVENEKYDVLVVDAFSSDTVPVHLLTREAVALYLSRLKPDGLLVFNTSNRYLDLAPVISALAKEYDLSIAVTSAIFLTHSEGAVPSEWIILSRDKKVLESPLFTSIESEQPSAARVPWTDGFSDVISAVHLEL